MKLLEFIQRQGDPTQGYAARFLSVVEKIKPLNIMNGPWLAGGSIRRLFDGTDSESDFDIFFTDEEQLRLFQGRLENAKVLYENEHNITLEVPLSSDIFSISKPFKLQLIKYYFNSPEDVINWFDYTNCQFITDGDVLIVGEYTLYDIGRKRLRVHEIHHAASSVRRMLKYGRQGYTVCDGTINDILQAVVANPEIIQEKIKYID